MAHSTVFMDYVAITKISYESSSRPVNSLQQSQVDRPVQRLHCTEITSWQITFVYNPVKTISSVMCHNYLLQISGN